jgi:hypothetical protein
MTKKTNQKQGIDFKKEFTTNNKVDLNKVKAFLQKYLVDECPVSIPNNIKDIIVKISPYATILGIILSIPAILTALGASAMTLPFIGFHSFYFFLGIVEAIVYIIFEIILLPGLFKRTKAAWNLMFNLLLVSLTFNIIGLRIFSAIIGAVIGAYILFQLRDKYTN